MKKRFLATTVVAITLLLGPGATVLVAGLCEHLQLNQGSCDSKVVETESGHHDMHHMQMEPATEPFFRFLTKQVGVLFISQQSCTHCAVHSRTGNSGVSQRSSVATRSHELTPAVTEAPSAVVFASKRWKLPSRAHGPPGDASSKHVLISVFRI